MPIKNMFKNKNGDTIVEVLLSIAVLSLVLSISFALSNRNSQYTQQSQERSEAQNISQQQIEELRKYLTPSTPWQTTYRCFDDLGQPSTGSGNSCSKGTKDNGVGRYNVTITATDTDGDGKAETYTVSTIWSSLTGAAQQSQAFSYKLPVSSLGPTGAAAICSDGDDNDGDGAIDLADPGCLGDPTRNDEVEPPVSLVVNVKKVPPLPGNLTPGCGAATQDRSGASVSVSGVGAQSTGSTSSTTFTPLSPNTSYTASVTGPSGYTVCAPTNQSVTTGGFGTTRTLDFKMYPVCTRPITGYTTPYYDFGARRPELDGYYGTLPPYYIPAPWAWNTSFVAPNVYAPGSFIYVFSGDTSRNPYMYYWLWNAGTYHPGVPIYGSYSCPS